MTRILASSLLVRELPAGILIVIESLLVQRLIEGHLFVLHERITQC